MRTLAACLIRAASWSGFRGFSVLDGLVVDLVAENDNRGRYALQHSDDATRDRLILNLVVTSGGGLSRLFGRDESAPGASRKGSGGAVSLKTTWDLSRLWSGDRLTLKNHGRTLAQAEELIS